MASKEVKKQTENKRQKTPTKKKKNTYERMSERKAHIEGKNENVQKHTLFKRLKAKQNK